MRRLFYCKLILIFFSGMGIAAIVFRFLKGLGLTTNMTDHTPWGLWKGLNVMSGVALAAGGFVIVAIVHIFHLNKFRPFLRATVLTSFLGYIIVPLGLILELGLPWNIWHPVVYGQHHSFLFEIALCVILYLSVLSMEFIPVVLEHPLFNRPLLQSIYRILKKISLPLIIAGIMLSTLHQSSLGGLFLIIPFRTHPLWYSPLITLLFFISAIGLGLSVIVFEFLLTSYLYKHKPKLDLLGSLGKASSIVLFLYLSIRIIDLIIQGKFNSIFNGTWQSNLFICEICISVIIPGIMFNLNKIRINPLGLFIASMFVIVGFILNRVNISIITFIRPENIQYFPSLIELFASLGLFSGASLIFLFFVEHVNLFDEDVYYLPENNYSFSANTSSGFTGPFRIINPLSLFSFLFILSYAFGFSFFNATNKPDKNYNSSITNKVQVNSDSDIFTINNGDSAVFTHFKHTFHQEKLGKKESCQKCHHRNIKNDDFTPCYQCHTDMYQTVSIFNHQKHQTKLKNKQGCAICHPKERTIHTYRPCKECHAAMYPEKLTENKVDYNVTSYMDAMHNACIPCHEKKWDKTKTDVAPDYCGTCHESMRSNKDKITYMVLNDGENKSE